LLHSMFPCRIYSLEFLALLCELFSNISWIKYWLQIHPLTLTLSPLFKYITHNFEFIVPNNDSLFKRFFERTKLHWLSVDYVLIKNLLNVIIVLNQESWFIWHQTEVDSLPYFLHFIQTHLNVVLFRCTFTYLDANLRMSHQSHL